MVAVLIWLRCDARLTIPEVKDLITAQDVPLWVNLSTIAGRYNTIGASSLSFSHFSDPSISVQLLKLDGVAAVPASMLYSTSLLFPLQASDRSF
jgi:hypothetical protein